MCDKSVVTFVTEKTPAEGTFCPLEPGPIFSELRPFVEHFWRTIIAILGPSPRGSKTSGVARVQLIPNKRPKWVHQVLKRAQSLQKD